MASTVRRRRKPAGSSIEPNQRVEDSHVRFMRGWAGTLNAIQRAHWPELRRLIEREQKRLGTRSDARTGFKSSGKEKTAAESVNVAMNRILNEYKAKALRNAKASAKRVNATESALEHTSSDAWADNIESLVSKAPALTPDERGFVNEFLIDEEPDIPKPVRREWIREQLGLISGQPVAPVEVAGKLIESISGRSMKRMRSAVTKGILRGTRVESIMAQLAKLPGITSRHAELLARDQVVKQNGRMTRIRHEGVGVTHYTWQTVGDQRVRKTHRDRQSKRYSYAKGPPNGENPGEEPQCRCWASPDLLGALAAAKKARARGDSIARPRRPRAGRWLRACREHAACPH